jgi:hypothetical protein
MNCLRRKKNRNGVTSKKNVLAVHVKSYAIKKIKEKLKFPEGIGSEIEKLIKISGSNQRFFKKEVIVTAEETQQLAPLNAETELAGESKSVPSAPAG